jgi:hypothetical protein
MRVGVVGITFPTTARDATARGIGRRAGRRGCTFHSAAALFPGGLMVLAGMLSVLMAAAGTAEPFGMVVL